MLLHLQIKTAVSYEKTASQVCELLFFFMFLINCYGRSYFLHLLIRVFCCLKEGEVEAEQPLHEAYDSGKNYNRNRRRTRRSRCNFHGHKMDLYFSFSTFVFLLCVLLTYRSNKYTQLWAHLLHVKRLQIKRRLKIKGLSIVVALI